MLLQCVNMLHGYDAVSRIAGHETAKNIRSCRRYRVLTHKPFDYTVCPSSFTIQGRRTLTDLV